MAQAVARALSLLTLVSDEGGTVTQLARRLGVDKSTASRIITALVDGHLLRRGHHGDLTLGPGLVRLARRYLSGQPLLQACQPAMAELQRITGETILLVEPLDAAHVICVAKMDSRQPLRIEGEVGARLPLYCGASGKAILAWLPEHEIAAALTQTTLQRFGPRSPVGPAAVRAQLTEARSRGYVVSWEELHAGVAGVAVPVQDGEGHPVAALSILAPMVRMDAARQDFLATSLRTVVSQIRWSL